jgi:hypothetical protein
MFALLRNFIKQLETDHLKRLKKLARKRLVSFFKSFSKVVGKFSESFLKVFWKFFESFPRNTNRRCLWFRRDLYRRVFSGFRHSRARVVVVIKVLKKTVNCQHCQLFEKNVFGYSCKKLSTVNTLNFLKKYVCGYFKKKLSTVNTVNACKNTFCKNTVNCQHSQH